MGDSKKSNVNLPPGFRFYPTDEELVIHFLQRKAALLPCHPDVIPDLDLYPYDPWQLEGNTPSFYYILPRYNDSVFIFALIFLFSCKFFRIIITISFFCFFLYMQ